jgi:hypothetical protein
MAAIQKLIDYNHKNPINSSLEAYKRFLFKIYLNVAADSIFILSLTIFTLHMLQKRICF